MGARARLSVALAALYIPIHIATQTSRPAAAVAGAVEAVAASCITKCSSAHRNAQTCIDTCAQHPALRGLPKLKMPHSKRAKLIMWPPVVKCQCGCCQMCAATAAKLQRLQLHSTLHSAVHSATEAVKTASNSAMLPAAGISKVVNVCAGAAACAASSATAGSSTKECSSKHTQETPSAAAAAISAAPWCAAHSAASSGSRASTSAECAAHCAAVMGFSRKTAATVSGRFAGASSSEREGAGLRAAGHDLIMYLSAKKAPSKARLNIDAGTTNSSRVLRAGPTYHQYSSTRTDCLRAKPRAVLKVGCPVCKRFAVAASASSHSLLGGLECCMPRDFTAARMLQSAQSKQAYLKSCKLGR
eukprot:14217-Heterococcus_DN1.PRE.5